MNETDVFRNQVKANIAGLAKDKGIQGISMSWLQASLAHRYSYNFSALGRPIIQYPQDMVAMQELIWAIRPDLIIETGIAHGGSLIMSAAMLSLLDYCDCVEKGEVLNPAEPKRKVLGIDVDIRQHNRKAIEDHPMSHRISMLEGSSVSDEIVQRVTEFASDYERVLVCLDSNHTHEHVLAELNAYAPLVSVGSYCVVFDTIVEDLPSSFFPDRPWGPGNNPKTAVYQFLAAHSEFVIDKSMDSKLLISVAPDGYLRRI
jgi:cephalosporin hydroxylase